MTKQQTRKRDSLRLTPVFDEAALQEAFRVSKINDDEARCIVRCVVLAYEVAKQGFRTT